jgi:hypothetical protein
MITRDDTSEFRAEIVMHCKMCLNERPPEISPRDWSRLSFGSFAKQGDPGIYFQLWCDRHEANVTTIYIENSHWCHADTAPLRVAGIDEPVKEKINWPPPR